MNRLLNILKYINAQLLFMIAGFFMCAPLSQAYTNPIEGGVTETVTNMWTVPGGDLYVGQATPNNSLIISNGDVYNTHGFVGSHTGSSNNTVSLIISWFSERSVWHNSETLYLGGHKDGTNWVDGGVGNTLSFYPNTGIFVGEAEANINYSLDAGIAVGDASGTPEMIIGNGTSVLSFGDCYIGYGTNESGSVEVRGEGSVWTAGYIGAEDYYLYVGRDGSGNQLTVSNGGLLDADGAFIGYGASAENNLVRVTGADSRWDGNSFDVGYFGSGNRLEISDGGQVISVFGGVLGTKVGADNNSILVTGTGSTWKTIRSNGSIVIGSRGKGNTLTISDGGEVHHREPSLIPKFVVGYYPGADNNAVFVTGNGSVLNNDGIFYLGGTQWGIGGRGNGLCVSDGGLVSVGEDMFSRNYSTVAVDDPDSRIEVGGDYYQDGTSILRLGIASNRADTAFLGVGGTAEFETGATLQYHSVQAGSLGFDHFTTNLLVEADTLIVGGITNTADLGDLEVVNLNSPLVEMELWEQNQDIYGLLSRRHLAESAGFAPGSQLALVSGEIDNLSVQGNALAVEQINLLNNMSASQQNAQMTQRYAQGSPAYRHNQALAGGRNQVLSQSRAFQSSARSQPAGPAGPHKQDQGLRGWIRGYGGQSDYESTASFSGFDQNVYGTVVGIDQAFGSVLLGAAGGYARSDLAQGNGDTSDAKTGYGMFYASLGTKDWFGDLSAGYGQSRVENRSGSLLGGSGSFTTDTVAFYFGGGREFQSSEKGGLIFTPEAALTAGYYDQPAYTDGLMQVDAYDRWSTQSRLGAALSMEKNLGPFAVTPELRTFWLHEFNADSDQIGYSLIGGTGRYSFGVQAPAEDILETGLGLSIALEERLELVFDLDAQYSAHYQALSAGARLAYEF